MHKNSHKVLYEYRDDTIATPRLQLSVSAYMFVVFISLMMTGTGCKKFLDVKPGTNTSINPHFIADFEQMLNNAALASPDYLAADVMSDDMILSDKLLGTYSSSFYVKAYNWWPTPWDPSESDPMYNNAYQMILQCNVILSRINLAPDGTQAQKNIIRAEAEINRAYYYLQLANLYGSGYNTATANHDLAVPLVLVPDASLLPARATVQQVYAQILQDLQDAVNTNDLPDFGIDVIHPGKAAALALQARAYLFMANYTQALAAANAALQLKSTMLDYNNFSFVNGNDPSNGVQNKPLTLTDEANDPEALLVRVCVDNGFWNKFNSSPFISQDLMTVFGNSDLRFTYNFSPASGNNSMLASYFIYNQNSMIFNYSIGVPEMLLIKAECVARQGDAATALAQLELIRKFRYKPADYVPLVNNGAADALTDVLTERRKELFFHGGLRLFDLKRLNLDNRFSKIITRVSDANGDIIATLKPGSPDYLIPFAPQIIATNPSIVQNAR
ncbi:MAG: RagB/SusD family nutrient uptake outer membrane protein [Mucilaginibacter sp.]